MAQQDPIMIEEDEKRPVFGNRYLSDKKNVFEHNAWDNVVWDAAQEEAAREKVTANSQTLISTQQQEMYTIHADQYWDAFYGQHQNRFFKDRHWLFTEFPELAGNAAIETAKATAEDTSPESSAVDKDGDREENISILEVGCGVGNTVFPILQTNRNPGLFVYCCDLSTTAIDIVKKHIEYDEKRCHAFVCDVSSDSCQLPCPPASLDIIILIFVLSAVHPARRKDTVHRLVNYLKPGGLIIFRDYGLYDMAQLRFKDGKCLSDNCYVRGDGTLVYFSTQEEVRHLFEGAGLSEEQNLVDRRLLVNRGRQLKMYRVWLQCKYRKPLT